MSFDHDANGNVSAIEDQNGTIIAQGFDDLDRLIGRDVTLGTGVGGDTEEDFKYDALNRLTEASDDDSTVRLTYDSLSRILTEVQGANPLSTEAKTVTYTWDAEGTYTYDAHEHLVEVADSGGTIATYTYDALGLGRRIAKTVGSDTTRYVYAGQQSVEEYDGVGSGANLLRLFVFGHQIDQILMMEAPDVADVDTDSNTAELLRFHYHTQLVGSVTQLTGPGQTVVESYEYDPYGVPTIKDAGGSTISASAVLNPYLFTGRQLDEEAGLYYYRARMYSPSLRRFIQRDPKEYVDGPNALTYCRARPILGRDPSGEGWLDDAVDAVVDAAEAVGEAIDDAANALADLVTIEVQVDWVPGSGAMTVPVSPIIWITYYNDCAPGDPHVSGSTMAEHERGHIRTYWLCPWLYFNGIPMSIADYALGFDGETPVEALATYLGTD